MKIGLIMQDYSFSNSLDEYDILIGVDKGAYNAYLNNIFVDVAIGDFDSIDADQLELISKNSKIIKLNPIKDQTDTAEALQYAYSLSSNVTMLGGIEGKRIEHFIANICLLKKYPSLRIISNDSLIYTIDKEHSLPIDYKFANFFALEDVYNLCLEGFKYNLSNYNLLQYDPLCISNEILSDSNKISLKKGVLLVILTKDDKNID